MKQFLNSIETAFRDDGRYVGETRQHAVVLALKTTNILLKVLIVISLISLLK